MEKRTDPLFGSMMWGGTFQGMPACIGSYSGGASLYVYVDGEWQRYAKRLSVPEVMPHDCKGCQQQLPMPDRSYMSNKLIKELSEELVRAIKKQAEEEHAVLDLNENNEPKIADEVREICYKVIFAARMNHGPTCGLCQS